MAGQLGQSWPETAQLLMEHFQNKCDLRGLVRLNFQVDGLPLSLNHQYISGTPAVYCKPDDPGAFKDKAGRWRKKSSAGFRHTLRPEALDWRMLVVEAMGRQRWLWKPTGVTAALILFESPYWLTGKRQVRENDIDNKTKPALDAVMHATEVPDELHWQLHVFKVQSKRQRTSIWLFDLGDVIESYY